MPYKDINKQRAYMREYSQRNKDKIKETTNRKVRCCCGAVVHYMSLCQHRKSKKHQAYEYHTCEGNSAMGFWELNTKGSVFEVDNEDIPENKPKIEKKEKPQGWEYTRCKKCSRYIIQHTLPAMLKCEIITQKTMDKTLRYFQKHV